MDDDAAPRSDSGEKFNGGGQRRKRPRKVSDGAPPGTGRAERRWGRPRPAGPRGGRGHGHSHGEGAGTRCVAAAPAGRLGVSWRRDGRFIFRMSECKREGGGGGSRRTGRVGGWRVCSVTVTVGKWLHGRCPSAPPSVHWSSGGKAAARTRPHGDVSLVCSAARLFPDTSVTALSGWRDS